MHTFINIVLAKTDEEKRLAEQAHQDWLKSQPTDAEVIANFLKDCEVFDDCK